MSTEDKTFNEIHVAQTCLALLLALASTLVSAYNESLSFRLSSSGTVQAVVSGLDDGPACQTEFVPPTSVVVTGTTVTITSPYTFYFCAIPFPPLPYKVVADLGTLTGSSYQVTWTEGPLAVSATLVPDALVPISIPTLSWSSVAIMVLCISLIGLKSERPLP